MLKKKGDTLVEVTLAVGIFSLVAIAVVAIMNGGISGAQTSLETTLAREEIDTQAEALRFIQTSAAADETSADQRFYKLWEEITDIAYDASEGLSEDQQAALLQFNPSTCTEAYSDAGNGFQKAFVINPRMLGKYADANSLSSAKSLYNSVLITNDSSDKLVPATTYPRLVYGGANNEWSGNLLEDSTFSLEDDLYHAEGIYVVGVRDPESTEFASDGSERAAYYDFYIRTCWYGTDADRPTTISTVIRLYDPNVIDKVDSSDSSVIHHSNQPLKILYDAESTGGSISGWSAWQTCSVYNEYTCLATTNKPTRTNYRFVGWATSPDGPAVFGSGNNILGGKTVEEYVANLVATTGKNQLNLYAVWKQDTLTYDFNGSTYQGGSWTQKCSGTCQIKTEVPARSGYEFRGWSATRGGPITYNPGDYITLEDDVTIYAVWKERNETLTASLSFPYGDCDSHVTGQRSNGSSFHAYYGSKVGSDINGLVLASLNYDYTSGGTETFTLNTLGGRDYYYYVHNYRGCSLGSATVTLSGPYTGTRTFYYNSAHATSGDWHVFAIKDGQLVVGW